MSYGLRLCGFKPRAVNDVGADAGGWRSSVAARLATTHLFAPQISLFPLHFDAAVNAAALQLAIGFWRAYVCCAACVVLRVLFSSPAVDGLLVVSATT
jgi:hypothetical protein